MEGVQVQFFIGIHDPTGSEANFITFKKSEREILTSMAKL